MTNKDRVKLLADALRSGKYKQGMGHLKYTWGEDDVKYCCLGVACEVAISNGVAVKQTHTSHEEEGHRYGIYDDEVGDGIYDDEVSVLPPSVRDWYGFDSANPSLQHYDEGEKEYITECATTINDVGDFDFNEIADMFEYTFIEREKENEIIP